MYRVNFLIALISLNVPNLVYQYIDILLVLNTMLVPGIYWMGQDWLLFGHKWGKRVLVLSLGLLIVGVVVAALNFGNALSLALGISFGFPFYHICLYKVSKKVFVIIMNREPMDAALNFGSGLLADRLYSILFVLISIFSSFALIGPIIWNTANS